MSSTAIFVGVPGKLHYEPPRLVVRVLNGREYYYWNYSTGRWTRLTRRCPYL